MYKIIARVFDKGQLVGYQLTNGVETTILDRQQVWYLARQKQVLGVIATESITKATLSGTSGFELKSLPKIEYSIEDNKVVIDQMDMYAAYLRHIIRTNSIKHKPVRELRSLCNNDIKNEVLTKQNQKLFSSNLVITSILHNEVIKVDTHRQYMGKRIGYGVSNIGKSNIQITRITPHGEKDTILLQSNQTIYLSMPEITILASKPEVACKFNNAILKPNTRPQDFETTLYNFLSKHIIELSNTSDRLEHKNIQDVVSQQDIKKYFSTHI